MGGMTGAGGTLGTGGANSGAVRPALRAGMLAVPQVAEGRTPAARPATGGAAGTAGGSSTGGATGTGGSHAAPAWVEHPVA